jgi:hypothetical protein
MPPKAKKFHENQCFGRMSPQLPHPSFRDGPKDQTRKFEIPGSMLRIAPE